MSDNIKTIKVGTFNLMNFMLPDRPVYGGSLRYNQDEYRRKSEWISFMLDQMDADIIGFQELFHREAMVRVIKDHPLYRRARVYIAEETGDQPSVALLSRYPVESMQVFTHFPQESIIDFNPKDRERVVLPFTTFTRPVIKADVRIDGYGLVTVFVVHLKSKREIFYVGESERNPIDLARAQSRSLMLRASESVAVRTLVADALQSAPGRPVILCGDVNDTGNAVTSRIISGEVPQHRLPDDVKRQVWKVLLYHVKDIQARRSYQDFYYTHIHNGMYESLDHIMVSQDLVTEYPRNTGRVGLVSVYNDHLVDQTFTQHGADKTKSDHGVVVCSIELDLARAEKFLPPQDRHASHHDMNPEKALSMLEQRRTNDRNYASAQETTRSEKFNVRDSLERWSRNHPQKKSSNRNRGFSADSRSRKTQSDESWRKNRPWESRRDKKTSRNDIIEETGLSISITHEDCAENIQNREYHSEIDAKQEENAIHPHVTPMDTEEKADVRVRAQRQRGLRRRSAMIDGMTPSDTAGDSSQSPSSLEDTDDTRQEKTRHVELVTVNPPQSVESKAETDAKADFAPAENVDVPCEKAPESATNQRRNRRRATRNSESKVLTEDVESKAETDVKADFAPAENVDAPCEKATESATNQRRNRRRATRNSESKVLTEDVESKAETDAKADFAPAENVDVPCEKAPESATNQRRNRRRATRNSESKVLTEGVESKAETDAKADFAPAENADAPCEKATESATNQRRNRRHHGRGAIGDESSGA